MTQASVGFHCPECTVSGRQQVHRGPIVIDPVATKALLVVNVAISLAVIVSGGGALGCRLARLRSRRSAARCNGEAYRILTSGCCTTGCSISGSTCTPSGSSACSSSGRWARPRFIALYFAPLIADPSARRSSIRSASPLARQGRSSDCSVLPPSSLAPGNRDIGNRLGAIVGINLVLTFAVPVLSIGGHVGGLLGGVAFAGAFVPQVREAAEWSRSP